MFKGEGRESCGETDRARATRCGSISSTCGWRCVPGRLCILLQRTWGFVLFSLRATQVVPPEKRLRQLPEDAVPLPAMNFLQIHGRMVVEVGI